MRNLLRADLRRILKRVSIYVWLFLIFVIFFLSALSKDYTADIIGMEQGVTSLLGPILVSIPVFLGVYGREIQAGSMQCVIGRGMSRTKLILTKYLECVLMCLFFFFFIWLAFFLRNNVGDAGLTANQNKMLTIFVLFAFIKTCGYFAFTTFFFFIAWSVAPGIVALLVSAFLMPMLFTMLDGFLKTDFSEFYFNGMIDNAYASIAAGDIGYTLILAIVLYIGGALLLTLAERSFLQLWYSGKRRLSFEKTDKSGFEKNFKKGQCLGIVHSKRFFVRHVSFHRICIESDLERTCFREQRGPCTNRILIDQSGSASWSIRR